MAHNIQRYNDKAFRYLHDGGTQPVKPQVLPWGVGVVDCDSAVPILGNPTMQQMDLIRVQQHNVISVNTGQACFTAEQLSKDYSGVFEGTGKLECQYKGATPVIHPTRRVPVALKGKLKKELRRFQSLGIIKKVTKVTPWVSSLVIVKKPNEQIRVCIDPKDWIECEGEATVDVVLPELSRAKVSSRLVS